MGYLNGVLMYVLSKVGNLCSSDFILSCVICI